MAILINNPGFEWGFLHDSNYNGWILTGSAAALAPVDPAYADGSNYGVYINCLNPSSGDWCAIDTSILTTESSNLGILATLEFDRKRQCDTGTVTFTVSVFDGGWKVVYSDSGGTSSGDYGPFSHIIITKAMLEAVLSYPLSSYNSLPIICKEVQN